jgi:hypothetical protein
MRTRPRLRIFNGDNIPEIEEAKINVKFGEICHLLTEAIRNRRTWLLDFEEDDIQMSGDLYELLCAYAELRPGA